MKKLKIKADKPFILKIKQGGITYSKFIMRLESISLDGKKPVIHFKAEFMDSDLIVSDGKGEFVKTQPIPPPAPPARHIDKNTPKLDKS